MVTHCITKCTFEQSSDRMGRYEIRSYEFCGFNYGLTDIRFDHRQDDIQKKQTTEAIYSGDACSRIWYKFLVGLSEMFYLYFFWYHQELAPEMFYLVQFPRYQKKNCARKYDTRSSNVHKFQYVHVSGTRSLSVCHPNILASFQNKNKSDFIQFIQRIIENGLNPLITN